MRRKRRCCSSSEIENQYLTSLDARAHEHALELRHRAEELLVLGRRYRNPSRAPPRRGCTSCGRTAPSARGRQVRHIALEVPLRALTVVGRRQCEPPSTRAGFSRCVMRLITPPLPAASPPRTGSPPCGRWPPPSPMFRTCRPQARWCCSTAAGTTAPGVERVMGFCTRRPVRGVLPLGAGVRAHARALRHPRSRSTGSRSRDEEQHLRFLSRIHDPLKQWKLFLTDKSRRRWEDTRAKEIVEPTHIPEAPWWIVVSTFPGARLNCIRHLLGQMPYVETPSAAGHRAARARASPTTRASQYLNRDDRAGDLLTGSAGSAPPIRQI